MDQADLREGDGAAAQLCEEKQRRLPCPAMTGVPAAVHRHQHSDLPVVAFMSVGSCCRCQTMASTARLLSQRAKPPVCFVQL